MNRFKRHYITRFIITALALSAAAPILIPLSGRAATVIVVSGDDAPKGIGTFLGAGTPSLNDLGQTAFIGRFTGGHDVPAGRGVFRSDGKTITPIVLAGDHSPDADGYFSNFSGIPWINNSGQVLVAASLRDTSGSGIPTPGPLDNQVVVRGDGPGVTLMARSDTLLSEVQEIYNFGSFNDRELNDSGQAAMWVETGVFASLEPAEAIILRPGKTVALTDFGGPHLFTDLGRPSLSNSGLVTYRGTFEIAPTRFGEGVFKGSGGQPIAEKGRRVPTDDAFYWHFGHPLINDLDQIAFSSDLVAIDGISDLGRAVFFLDDTGVRELVRAGEPSPDGDGKLDSISVADINNVGQVLIRTTLFGASGIETQRAIYRLDGEKLTLITRTGMELPGGTKVTDIGPIAMNDLGQVAFLAFDGVGDVSEGIYLYDDVRGVTEVAHVGDALLGNEVRNLFTSSTFIALNNREQIAFAFYLNDGRSGVALSNSFGVPEPSTATLAVLVLVALGPASTRNFRRGSSLACRPNRFSRSINRGALAPVQD